MDQPAKLPLEYTRPKSESRSRRESNEDAVVDGHGRMGNIIYIRRRRDLECCAATTTATRPHRTSPRQPQTGPRGFNLRFEAFSSHPSL
jgi:hypothetical protein